MGLLTLLLEPILYHSFITLGFRLKSLSNSGIVPKLLPEGYPSSLLFFLYPKLLHGFIPFCLQCQLMFLHLYSRGVWSTFTICESLKRPICHTAHLLYSLHAPSFKCCSQSFFLLALCFTSALWHVLVRRRELTLYVVVKASEILKFDSGLKLQCNFCS